MEPPRDERPGGPAVVAIIVAHDTGSWLDACLESVLAQEPPIPIVVVDTGDEPLEARVHSVAPEAHVRRVPAGGYGAAANDVFGVVEGATHHLFLHDDVTLAPDCVARLVAEAEASDAGIVGPKLVRPGEERVLVSVGLGVDKTAHPVPLVDPGEVDQHQHDGTREVAALPGGVLLVRADVFAQIGGFDEAITFLGDDVDLCWRARLAGHRVVVVPAAVATHREALGVRRPPSERRGLAARHRLRTLLVTLGPLHLVRILPQALAVTVGEALYAVMIGQPGQAAEVLGAWPWNLRRLGDLRVRRRLARSTRAVSDRTIRSLHVGGVVRLSMFARGQIGRDGPTPVGIERVRRLSVSVGPRVATSSMAAVALVVAVLVIGGRDLSSGIPVTGTLPGFAGLGDLWNQLVDPWRPNGMGSLGPPAPALAVMAGLSALAGGSERIFSMAVVAVPAVALLAGTWRLARPATGVPGASAAVLVVAAAPALRAAMASGDLDLLVGLAAAPWILAAVGRGGGWWSDPTDEPHTRPRLPVAVASLRFGAGLAVVVALSPTMIVVPLLVVVGGATVVWVLGISPAVRAPVSVAAGGIVVALLVLAPWLVTLTAPGVDLAALFGRGWPAVDPIDVLTGGGGHPTSSLAWVWPVAAAVAPLAGRGSRLAGSLRAWGIIVVTLVTVTAVANIESLDLTVGAMAALVVPLLGLAVAHGVATLLVDIGDARLGFGQLAGAVGVAAVAVGTLAWIVDAGDGRWEAPPRSHREALAGVSDALGAQRGQRTVWIGPSPVVPAAGWALRGGLVAAVTTDGLPDAIDRWAPLSPGATGVVLDGIRAAADGRTTQLGRLLAPMGVRQIVVLSTVHPSSTRRLGVGSVDVVSDALSAQVDLERVRVDASTILFRNAAWAGRFPDVAPAVADALGPRASDAASVDLVAASGGAIAAAGDVPTGQVARRHVVVSAEPNDVWCVAVDGECLRTRSALGSVMVTSEVVDGHVEIRRHPDPADRLVAVVMPMGLWAVVAAALWRTRHRDDPVDATEDTT